MINTMIMKIKRRETPFYDKLYHLIKRLRKGSIIPSIYIIHRPLYTLTRMLISFRWMLQEKLWSIPLFKSIVKKCGTGLSLPNGVPWLDSQTHLQIEIGNNVTIAKASFFAGHIHNHPILKIGNNTTIGYNTMISVNERVEIGNNVMIAHNCFIADCDGHPLDPMRRMNHESVTIDEVKPIIIGNNVWVGSGTVILKGTEIGDNTVISSNSVISGKILPNKIMMGIPARAIKSL